MPSPQPKPSPSTFIEAQGLSTTSHTFTSFDQGRAYGHANDSLNAGLGASPDFQNNLLLVPFIRFCYDNLDDPYFAKSGINTTLSPFGLTVQWSDFTKRIGVYFSVGYSF